MCIAGARSGGARLPGTRVLRTDDHEAVGFDLGVLELLADPDAALAYLGPDLLADDSIVTRRSADSARTPSRPSARLCSTSG